MNKNIKDFIINDILKYQSNNWNRNYYKLIDFISRIKNEPILYFDDLKTCRGYYDRRRDFIVLAKINSAMDTVKFYRTYLHELAHATSHFTRLNRYPFDIKLSDETYIKEEIIAEYTTAMIMVYYGFKEILLDGFLDDIEFYYELLDNPNDLYECIDYSKEAYNYLMN